MGALQDPQGGSHLFPSGWKATLLMGPKCPLTLPNSSSKAKWKNLGGGRLKLSQTQGGQHHRILKNKRKKLQGFSSTANFPKEREEQSLGCQGRIFPARGKRTNLASNLPILVEVVVTSMASCPPPSTTCRAEKPEESQTHSPSVPPSGIWGTLASLRLGKIAKTEPSIELETSLEQ